MPKRNLFKKLNHPVSSHPLKPFDLSTRKIYSSRAGLCLPELCLQVYKGEKYRIDTTVFNRTEKLLSPAYFRCKQFHHYFFVPYHTLWHEWDAFYTRSTEQLSAATYSANYFPNFDVLDFITKLKVGTASGLVSSDMLGFSATPGIDRMLQMLHYGSLSMFDNIASPSLSGKYCNLAAALAYQKIWYWYYRDKRHQPPTLFNNFVKYYNVDDIDSSTVANSHIDLSNSANLSRICNIFLPRYRTWDSDVFTNSFVDTQFGSVSVLNSEKVSIVSGADFTGQSINQLHAGAYTRSGVGDNVLDLRDSSNNHVTGSTYWDIPSLFDVLQLRKAVAVQHWRELMLRAGDSSRDRYIAMFGTAPKRSEEAPTLLGGFDVNLNIDDVTATAFDNQQASGDNAGLGQLAGKGIMSSDGHLEFIAPDHGILMCISSILPLTEYDGSCIDKANTLVEPTDFFIPQYDNLGFEPIMKFEENIRPLDVTNGYIDTVIGYTVRNHHLKTNVDRIYNNFRSGKSESFWACSRNTFLINNPALNYNLNFRNFYVSPAVVNHLFDRSCLTTTSSPDLSYNEDQFKCLTYFDIKALRPMSELGLPPL